MNILPGAGGSDRGPDGTRLQISNPADEEPDLCTWCGGNAEDGATVPVVTREEAESVHPSLKVIPAMWYGNGHGWGIRLCETCNEERKAKWEDEDFDLGLERICEHLGISAELSPMERSAAAIEKIKELAPATKPLPPVFGREEFESINSRIADLLAAFPMMERDEVSAAWIAGVNAWLRGEDVSKLSPSFLRIQI